MFFSFACATDKGTLFKISILDIKNGFQILEGKLKLVTVVISMNNF